MTKPLMPMATAVWLVENTSLTFRQIARFCELHVLEVQAIADETVGQNMVGQDPTLTGQLTWEEIERCQIDPAGELQILIDEVPAQLRTKGPRYTPVSKRQDKPDAIAWLLRHHPEMSDAQIGRLIGTTKPTIEAIRSKSHWNIKNIQPKDPVSLGLCGQIELDEMVRKAHAKAAKAVPPANPKAGKPAPKVDEPEATEPAAPEAVESAEPEAAESAEPEAAESDDPEAAEPAEPAASEAVEPAEPEAAESDDPEAAEPAEPEAPEAAEPAEPEAAEAAEPAEPEAAEAAEPAEPEAAEAAEPAEPEAAETAEPAEPEAAEAAEPAEPEAAEAAEPDDPEAAEPAVPEAAEPAVPEAAEPAEPSRGEGEDTVKA
jgi:hypothetical protein